MESISINILNLALGSVCQKAALVKISVVANTKTKLLSLSLKDDGDGAGGALGTELCKESKEAVAYFIQRAKATGGSLTYINSLTDGFSMQCSFKMQQGEHIPLSEMTETITQLVKTNPITDYVYSIVIDDKAFVADTGDMRREFGASHFSSPKASLFIREYIEEHSLHLKEFSDM